MSDMKCPFCNGELKRDYYDCGMLECHNPKCKHYYDDFIGREELWQELIRTRKALDIAVKRLGYIKNNYKSWTPDRDEQMIAQAANGLDEINTALEQKRSEQ